MSSRHQKFECIFHMGMPKTGTSSLQNVMSNSTIPNINYPTLFRVNKNAHHELPQKIVAASSEELRNICVAIQNQVKEICSSGNLKTLYSSEGMTALCGIRNVHLIEALGSLLESEVKPLFAVIVREMTSFLEAMYLQSRRFGGLNISFTDYVDSRLKWIKELFQGLVYLQQELSEITRIDYQIEGLNTLSVYEQILELDSNFLVNKASMQRPTSRFSLKCEATMFYCEELSTSLGVKLDRNSLVTFFENGSPFVHDIKNYTLFEKKQRLMTHEHICDLAVDVGLLDYANHFHSTRFLEQMTVNMSSSLLNDDDLAVLLSHASDKNHLPKVA